MSEDGYLWSVALKRAIRRNRQDAHNRYLQLATVRRDGSPAVRSLVFREFCDATMQLRMVTDRRSGKVDEIAASPAGEVSWYFTRSREQFRLHGRLALTGAADADQAIRLALWKSLSEKAREQFFWPQPGDALDTSPPAAFPESDEPPDDFLLLALTVTGVDHLTLRGDPQSRVLSQRDERGVWSSRPVNP